MKPADIFDEHTKLTAKDILESRLKKLAQFFSWRTPLKWEDTEWTFLKTNLEVQN